MAKLVFQQVLTFSRDQFYDEFLIIHEHFVNLKLSNISLVFYITEFKHLFDKLVHE